MDQGYMGLSLASCHKDEIWDLRLASRVGTRIMLFIFFLFRDQIFPKPRFFSETRLSKTETEAFKILQKSRDRNLNLKVSQ